MKFWVGFFICFLLTTAIGAKEDSFASRSSLDLRIARMVEARRKGAAYSHFLNAVVLEQYGSLDRALHEYDRVLELEPSATLIYRQRATLHLKMGAPEKALADAQSYVRAHPEDVESRLLLSNIHLLLGQRTASQLILEKILDENPNHPEALMTLATLIMSEKPEQAIKFFKQLIEIDPSLGEAHYNLGLIYQKLGDTEKSKEMFKKVTRLAGCSGRRS